MMADTYTFGTANGLTQMVGLFGMQTEADVAVTTETALSLPAVFSGVNFLSGTLASLPLEVFRIQRQRGGASRQDRIENDVSRLLSQAANDELSAFEHWRQIMVAALTEGRGLSWIERDGRGRPLNLWPVDPCQTRIKAEAGRRTYRVTIDGRERAYPARDVIDIPFMSGVPDQGHILGVRSPLTACRHTIGLAIAVRRYASRFYQNGGVPPLALTAQFESGASMARAQDDIAEAMKTATRERRQVLALPVGADIKAIGLDADRAHLIAVQKFLIEEIARLYNLPPIFLQDLTHGTMSNTEQQDLHFVKHTLRPWVEQIEGEINLKLFGRGRRNQVARFDLSRIQRGDAKARAEANRANITAGVMTPNEARDREDLPPIDGGDVLMMQGAMAPIDSLGGSKNDS